jgi:isoleucyl-tRNA synthetase
MYPEVESQPSLPRLEEAMLAAWERDGVFRASVEARPSGEDGSNEYVFYDGPPFANGLPHYGHLLTGFVKDAVPRYRTMRGQRVERRFGWDCHGLPAEAEAERQLGISGRQAITDHGTRVPLVEPISTTDQRVPCGWI